MTFRDGAPGALTGGTGRGFTVGGRGGPGGPFVVVSREQREELSRKVPFHGVTGVFAGAFLLRSLVVCPEGELSFPGKEPGRAGP